jgi:hypothetical protein
MGEQELKNFFNSTAWKSTPGFSPDGRNLSDIEYRQERKKKRGGIS